MKSQGIGGATQRYFVLNSHSIRYWKSVPVPVMEEGRSSDCGTSASAAVSNDSENDGTSDFLQGGASMAVELEPCKGQFSLTHETVIRRSKTLFGNNTIELKSQNDMLTICAYTSAEDEAWFSELFNAVVKLKKAHRDKLEGSERNFPELTWRSPEPACVALGVDVFDPAAIDEHERVFRARGAKQARGEMPGDTTPFSGTYAVLCRIKNGPSTIHSVQIGPNHHIPIRLENSDLDAGVQLSTVRLCGDCLIVSGSHGFVGSGRIPSLQAPAHSEVAGSASRSASGDDKSSNAAANPSQRIYVRRMVNCFHGEDAHVTSLAIPRVLVVPRSKSTSKPQSSPGGCANQKSTTANILASGDEIGGVCVWRREEGGRGVLHYPTYDGQQSKNKHRAGYSWQCVHRYCCQFMPVVFIGSIY
jgi:hypothetical protein